MHGLSNYINSELRIVVYYEVTSTSEQRELIKQKIELLGS
jgi:hypothetical protein